MDMIGDISHHLSRPIAPVGGNRLISARCCDEAVDILSPCARRRSPSKPPATLGPGMLSRETPVTV
jgi:hypothetical protein